MSALLLIYSDACYCFNFDNKCCKTDTIQYDHISFQNWQIRMFHSSSHCWNLHLCRWSHGTNVWRSFYSHKLCFKVINSSAQRKWNYFLRLNYLSHKNIGKLKLFELLIIRIKNYWSILLLSSCFDWIRKPSIYWCGWIGIVIEYYLKKRYRNNEYSPFNYVRWTIR